MFLMDSVGEVGEEEARFTVWSFQSHVAHICADHCLSAQRNENKDEDVSFGKYKKILRKRRDTNKYPEENKCSRWKYPFAQGTESSKTRN